MLHNLISNAIKFSQRNSVVRVEAYYFKKEQILQVSVIDKGSGIPEKDFDKLFKPYSTLKSAESSGKSGAGLGLYVCKMICKELKGDIRIIPDLNERTAFTFNVRASAQLNNEHDESVDFIEFNFSTPDPKQMIMVYAGSKFD